MNQVMNANENRKVRTYIELSTRAERVCRVIGYEPHDALSRLTDE